MALLWDASLMPSDEDWSVRGGSRSGGRSLAGSEQVVLSPTARWKASLTIPCFEPESTRAARRLISMGRSATWLVGPFERERAPWVTDPLTGGQITDADGLRDSAANSAWGANADTKADLDFRLAAQTAPGDGRIAIQRFRGGLLYPGMVFSIIDRLHMIVDLDAPDTGGGTTIFASVRPLLRAGCPSSQSLEFAKPAGQMRLASDDTGALQLQLSRYGTLSIELEEAF